MHNFLFVDKNLLPEPRSVFRYHEHCWKFYLDLDRLKMGFQQKDYDYIIDILKLYVDEQATDKIFYYTCEILRNEIRRSFKNHVKTLLQRAGNKINNDKLIHFLQLCEQKNYSHFIEELYKAS